MNELNPLKKRIGIIGGGQLGRMMIEDSLRLNIEFNVLDVADCPSGKLAHHHIAGKITDASMIKELAAISDVLTYEIEHVNVEALIDLELQGKEIIPSPKVLRIVQDKGIQKQFFIENGIPTSPFILVETAEDWKNAIVKLGGDRLVAKTRRDGYDGKGVMIFTTGDVLENPEKRPFHEPALLEAFVPCEKEISVMVALSRDGQTLTWPVVEMEFDPQANLVTFLDCPANIGREAEQKAREIACKTIEALKSPGVYAVEMFLTGNGDILVNEIAPRPHNSGHHSIEACYTSQFEQLVRILCGLPLGSTRLIQPAVMLNLLGSTAFSGPYRIQGLEEASAIEGVYVHLYGKTENKPMRKMGHITVVAETKEEAKKRARQVEKLIKFVKDQ